MEVLALFYGVRVIAELSKAIIIVTDVLHNYAINERNDWVVDEEYTQS